jgi:hygromycin-B 7''-O-kinase
MPKDHFLHPHVADPVWTDEEVLSLARLHAPHARTVRQVEESGGEARTYLIDDDLLLKAQRPNRSRPRTSLEREVAFLKELEGREGITVPEAIGHGRTEWDGEYTVMTRMPGKPVRHCSLQPDTRQSVLRELGAMLRRIHEIPPAALTTSPLFPGDRSPVDAFWRFGNLVDEVVEAAGKNADLWSYRLTPQAVADKVMSMLPTLDTFVALHSNPGPEHTFAAEASGVLVGLIDFGDSYIAHPVHDLFRWLRPDDRSAIYAGYTAHAPVDEEWDSAWRAACIVADMRLVLRHPEAADSAYAEIEAILGGW